MKLPFASTRVAAFFARSKHYRRYSDSLTLRNALDWATCDVTIVARAMPPPLRFDYGRALGGVVDLRSELLPLSFFWAFKESQ